jgi:hypothetical protein
LAVTALHVDLCPLKDSEEIADSPQEIAEISASLTSFRREGTSKTANRR